MPTIKLEEDPIDEILYLARANESSELESFLTELSAERKFSKADLVTAAIDPHSKNSALHYAAGNGHIDIIKLLLSYKLDNATATNLELINTVNDAGNTALHWAALNGHLECVKQLVQAGADVTIINKAGHDAVFEAEINDKKDVVDWLLETVEELENGIGQTGENTSENSDNGMNAEGHGTVADVEDARRQMEGMSTVDGKAQGG
ncbi:ankyrin [Aaosphaeria arxii CBS 175.79]|uniref:Ankyrin n=1 Tax=Aaosphaeria arxii CBS 175.79 TaxID=1450172 RepID=A0A6A5Y751_9PLEO|nr:ankyrin [Aaosphaeria arxii CBS 175.79]KAF2021395.1 ankyrin [Aaosphaeria arxii CBS 175.79]